MAKGHGHLNHSGGAALPVLLGALLMLTIVALVLGGEAAVSTKSFCTSCHSMSYPAGELKDSPHYGALGVDPGCKDCHIPQGLENLHRAVWTHIVDGGRDLYMEMTLDLSDREKFEKRRLEMAHRARMNMKKQDSLTCRSCHKNPRPFVEEGQLAHRKMETEGATCIDCHQNLVHREVEESDLDASLESGAMVLRD